MCFAVAAGKKCPKEEEEQFLRKSVSSMMTSSSRRRDSLHSTSSYGVHDPLTDDEFQRALSNHSSSHIAMDYTQPIVGSDGVDICTSFEQQLKNLDDSISSRNASIVHTASLDDDDDALPHMMLGSIYLLMALFQVAMVCAQCHHK